MPETTKVQTKSEENPWYIRIIQNKKEFGTPEWNERIEEALKVCPNPYALPLQILQSQNGVTNLRAKKLIKSFVLHLGKCLEKVDELERDRLLNADDRIHVKEAFKCVFETPRSELFDLFNTLYQFPKFEDDLNYAVDDLAKEGKYIDACILMTKLEVEDEAHIQTVLFPLIFADNQRHFMSSYFRQHLNMQLKYLTLLNELIDQPHKTKSLCEELIKQHNLKDLPEEMLNCDFIRQFKKKLCGALGVDTSDERNFNEVFAEVEKTIVRRVAGKISEDIFNDRILYLIPEDNKRLQLCLIERLTRRGLEQDANYFMGHFKLDAEVLPDTIKSTLEGVEFVPRYAFARRESTYSMDLETVETQLIDNEKRFKAMLDGLSTERIAIAFRANNLMNGKDVVFSLMQIATLQRIYLVDAIEGQFSKECWQSLVQVLNAKDIIYGNRGTTRGFQTKEFAELETKMDTGKVLVLPDFFLYVKRMHAKPISAYFSDGNIKSMDDVVFAIKKQRFPTSAQLTVWTKRPLRAESLHYAALTAYSILDMFKDMERILTKSRLIVMNIVREYLQGTTAGPT